MARKRISRSAARAMLDAMEGFQTDRTVWIDSGLVDPAARSAVDSIRPLRNAINEAERLLASFVERTMRKPPARPDDQLASLPMTGPVEWFDQPLHPG